MRLPILSLILLLGLSAAIAVPAPNPDSALAAKDFIPNKFFGQGVPLPGRKWVKPTSTPGPEDNVLPFSDSADAKTSVLGSKKSNAFCPHPGTAYCCNDDPETGGTRCKWNGDGHMAGCELVTGGESVCCSTLGCEGMSGLKEPITV
ncbi:hypothetical protein EAE96_009581 [Botrytis aclada]|nr:hypothetical protein EAE96_009581 [Botrytis aclada]